MGEKGGVANSSEAVAQPPDGSVAGASRTVFLSYASADALVANQVCEFLESHGVSCWMAPRDVKPGTVYADAIVRAINEASALVLVTARQIPLTGKYRTNLNYSRKSLCTGRRHRAERCRPRPCSRWQVASNHFHHVAFWT